jgi:hypothetical protein
MNNVAPIVLFVFNRPVHTRRTVEALQKNERASESDLFIYADAARTPADEEAVGQVREYIATIDGFKSVTVIAQEHNKGLAASIIDGVTDVVNRYGRVIVLEDDIVTSPYFLQFMNDALDHYENEKKVWHISGWNYPIDGEGIGDVFLWRLMNCWGWATWADRWAHFEKDPQKLIDTMSKDDIYRFNLDGAENFWGHVIANKNGTMNTWAIFWYATIFQKNGLCLNPRQTLVDNIGIDGSGVHCDSHNNFGGTLADSYDAVFQNDLTENKIALDRVRQFYKKRRSLPQKVKQKIASIIKK